MDRMRWGKKRSVEQHLESTPRASEFGEDSAVLLIFCCICGAALSGDFEDEINGEGWGRDICGDCNRTKNDEALFGR